MPPVQPSKAWGSWGLWESQEVFTRDRRVFTVCRELSAGGHWGAIQCGLRQPCWIFSVEGKNLTSFWSLGQAQLSQPLFCNHWTRDTQTDLPAPIPDRWELRMVSLSRIHRGGPEPPGLLEKRQLPFHVPGPHRLSANAGSLTLGALNLVRVHLAGRVPFSPCLHLERLCGECSLRPSGIFGTGKPASRKRWMPDHHI